MLFLKFLWGLKGSTPLPKVHYMACRSLVSVSKQCGVFVPEVLVRNAFGQIRKPKKGWEIRRVGVVSGCWEEVQGGGHFPPVTAKSCTQKNVWAKKFCTKWLALRIGGKQIVLVAGGASWSLRFTKDKITSKFRILKGSGSWQNQSRWGVKMLLGVLHEEKSSWYNQDSPESPATPPRSLHRRRKPSCHPWSWSRSGHTWDPSASACRWSMRKLLLFDSNTTNKMKKGKPS